MSFPVQSPPPQQPGGGAGRTALLILLGVGCLTLFCCGGVAVLGALAFTRTKTDLQRMRASLKARALPAQPPLVAPQWQMDWVTMSQLTPVFTAALDTVSTDKQVLERLGTPIETTGDSETLFRREGTGMSRGADETIEFDIQGPRGTAVVRVTTGSQNPLPGGPGRLGLGPATITVTLADGTEINVLSPATQTEP